MEKEDSLPLFITSDDPVLTYIVADKVIDFKLIPIYRGHSTLAYHFLGELFSNKITQQAIPDILYQEHIDNFQKVSVVWPCLSGILFEGHSHCLAAKMTIHGVSKEKAVELHDFAFIDSGDRRDCSVSDYDLTIHLTTKEAFLLLANLCVTGVSLSLSIGTQKDDSLTREHARKRLDEYYEKELQSQLSYYKKIVEKPRLNRLRYGKEELETIQVRYNNLLNGEKYSNVHEYYLIKLFCIDYLFYLKDQIQMKKISPSKLLQLSGVHSLAMLSELPEINAYICSVVDKLLTEVDLLSFNQKISYYTLFMVCELDYENQFPKFKQILVNNKQFFQKLEWEFTKKIYRTSGKIVNHNDVYLKYLGRAIW